MISTFKIFLRSNMQNIYVQKLRSAINLVISAFCGCIQVLNRRYLQSFMLYLKRDATKMRLTVFVENVIPVVAA